MPKELIVSVNGREKKIAIIENGKVTEFYIERGEGHQGIVGNIYKGRVMRVLPGMQSAFVDIGLERDAFLYVSDFFDEEEEFERIVVDKSKGDASTEAVVRAAAEKLERARIERERQIETAQERAEPLLTMGKHAEDETEEEDDEAMAAPVVAGRPQPTEETEMSNERRGRRDRSRRGGKDRERAEQPRTPTAPPTGEPTPPTSFAEEVRARLTAREEIETPFAAAGGASFHRIVDEDEAAAGEGEMFKDARLQERIFNQIHAIEFDIETPATAEVGSLLAGATGASSFQRIDDSDIADASPHMLAAVQPEVAAAVASFTDDVLSEPAKTTGAPQSFERVSDDEKAVEALPTEEAAPAAKRGSRGKQESSAKARQDTTKSRKKSAASSETAPEATEETGTTKKKKDERATKAAAPKDSSKKGAATEETAAAKGRSKRSRSAASNTATEGGATAEMNQSAAQETAARTEPLADSEASLKATQPRGEFARRGGRRRSRRGGKPGAEGNGGGEEDRSNGHAEEVSEPVEVEAVAEEQVPEAPAPAPAGGGRQARQPRSDRGGRGSRDNRDNRDRRSAPTITDLLREGQEILVQIAKEPIAQKGARITSHIALPGRHLVYMPTIEHVGVSRKIESDSERQRLRKLIQTIRAAEDVPSGGFIVRTAGIGVSEQDLRDDARYLVRTWRDIRRGAEKQKAPALAHRDLDLVQRILRDQMSDDFTAIRVDSEEEYQSIVEFVNRIQPKLVNRVKLYTREEPILEAFGVQAEIDKAIKPRVWLRSGGYLVINQTEALVAIDVNTGKFVGRGGSRLEDTITRTNLEAVEEIARQIRLRDLGGIIVLDLIDMEDRRNRQRVMTVLQDALRDDKSPTKVLSFNDFGLVIMTRKRVKQSLERTLCSPCPYCQGAGLVKSAQTICYEILEEARSLSRSLNGDSIKQTTLRLNPEVARALRSTERDVLTEIEDYLGAVDITSDENVHQEQFDFAFV
ncbi:MAG: Rne/Rng family ribonuclease [Acidobacteriota bacterium]|nr:Rne/Rng family ribonuclease [Acidobacteriota bacterium]